MRRASLTVARQAAILVLFVGIAVGLRGKYLSSTQVFNADEAEFMAQAHAAVRDLVPFTTWTTSTTGPVWPIFLGLLGLVGLPLTIPFAHLLAAVLLGLIGYVGFRLARRGLDPYLSAILTASWWLPIVLTLVGTPTDFGALNSELLPTALILAAALVSPELLRRRPVMYLVVGVLAGLAVGAKYQFVPLAAALLIVQLLVGGVNHWRQVVRPVLLFAAGVVAPLVVIIVAMLVSPNVSTSALKMTLNFLADYTDTGSFNQRVAGWADMTRTAPGMGAAAIHILLLLLAVCWLGARSNTRSRLARALLVITGVVAVYLGGHAFPHYLYLIYAAIVMALGLPLKPDAQVVPRVARRELAAAVVAVVAVVAWVVSFGTSHGSASRAGRHALHEALAAHSVAPVATLQAVCPAGSSVLVWGWAPELYVNQSWRNAVPFVVTVHITWSPKNYQPGYQMVRAAIENPSTACVVDAVGPPFFGVDANGSLTKEYPGVAEVLDRDYRRLDGALQCSACSVYVRTAAAGRAGR